MKTFFKVLAGISLLAFIIIWNVTKSGRRKQADEEIRLNGKLRYQKEVMKWCISKDIKFDWVYVDSAYYSNCKTCIK